MFALAFAAAFVTDALTKSLVVRHLAPDRVVPDARLPVRLRHLRSARPPGGRGVVLAWLVTTVAASALVAQTAFGDAALAQAGLGLAAGGAAGNAADRLSGRGVLDFVHFRGWPVFNLADAAIVCGIALTLWGMR
jgi:signal peptidase II